MGFLLTDLIIESIIRDGLQNLRQMPEIVDDIFSQLVNLPLSLATKYGDAELNKIKDFVKNRELSVRHSFPPDNTPMPCISIQLMAAVEDTQLASMDDYQANIQTPMSPAELAEKIYASNLELQSYDANSGIISVGDTEDLATVHPNLLLVDASGNEFAILGGINNTPGSRQIIIQKRALNLDLNGPAVIKSSIDYNENQVRTNVEKERLLIGIHTKDALLTKYVYTLVKYFIESRKKDLINSGFNLATYEGSDFNANPDYGSDFIYSRYITITGTVYNNWNSDQVVPIDWITVQAKVQRAEATNADLGLQTQTIQVEDDDKQS